MSSFATVAALVAGKRRPDGDTISNSYVLYAGPNCANFTRELMAAHDRRNSACLRMWFGSWKCDRSGGVFMDVGAAYPAELDLYLNFPMVRLRLFNLFQSEISAVVVPKCFQRSSPVFVMGHVTSIAGALFVVANPLRYRKSSIQYHAVAISANKYLPSRGYQIL